VMLAATPLEGSGLRKIRESGNAETAGRPQVRGRQISQG
jgi:hypothetical protein